MTCLTCDDSLGDIDAEDAWHSDMAVAPTFLHTNLNAVIFAKEFPLRKAWSGSNDFTLRYLSAHFHNEVAVYIFRKTCRAREAGTAALRVHS